MASSAKAIPGRNAAEKEPRERALAVAAREWFLLIDGGWRPALTGQTLDVIDPSTGRPMARAPAAQAPDVDLAVTAARRAFDEGRWLGVGATERGRCLLRVADLIDKHAAELQLIEILNNGVPPNIAEYFTTYAADAFRYYAGWCGKTFPGSPPIFPPKPNFTPIRSKSPWELRP